MVTPLMLMRSVTLYVPGRANRCLTMESAVTTGVPSPKSHRNTAPGQMANPLCGRALNDTTSLVAHDVLLKVEQSAPLKKTFTESDFG